MNAYNGFGETVLGQDYWDMALEFLILFLVAFIIPLFIILLYYFSFYPQDTPF